MCIRDRSKAPKPYSMPVEVDMDPRLKGKLKVEKVSVLFSEEGRVFEIEIIFRNLVEAKIKIERRYIIHCKGDIIYVHKGASYLYTTLHSKSTYGVRDIVGGYWKTRPDWRNWEFTLQIILVKIGREIEGSGKVTYDQKSLNIKKRWENAYLISITKEELEENREDIEDKLKKPLRTAIIKAPLEVVEICLKETLKKIAGEYGPVLGVLAEVAKDMIEGKYGDIPKDLAKEIIKQSFLLELKKALIAQGVSATTAALLTKAVGISIAFGIPIGTAINLVYGSYPIMKQEISYGIEFMYYTLATLGHVNFIIVKTEQSKFDVWLISYEKRLVAGRVDINPNKAIPYYIGTYDKLPKIFLRKMLEVKT